VPIAESPVISCRLPIEMRTNAAARMIAVGISPPPYGRAAISGAAGRSTRLVSRNGLRADGMLEAMTVPSNRPAPIAALSTP
jgi:hypothetical protein